LDQGALKFKFVVKVVRQILNPLQLAAFDAARSE
jgi:hypothetical protein